MVKRTGPTNYQVRELLTELEQVSVKNKFWKRILNDLVKPTRQRRIVNIYKINKFAQDGETVIVPGKVLSVGDISKKVEVAAMNFSLDAKRKIESAKGRAISIRQLLDENPEGKKVRILG
ncbi:MAG TPA: 50S ribosomal protein L18e [Candidatus Nanoarchaeia archaeon]|nr:50S ribosomal protein L18e [Candidatus Nanoarchaeia archaeon]